MYGAWRVVGGVEVGLCLNAHYSYFCARLWSLLSKERCYYVNEFILFR